MTFTLKKLATLSAVVATLALVGCDQKAQQDPNHIKVGVVAGAEQQVAEVAQKVAKD